MKMWIIFMITSASILNFIGLEDKQYIGFGIILGSLFYFIAKITFYLSKIRHYLKDIRYDRVDKKSF